MSSTAESDQVGKWKRERANEDAEGTFALASVPLKGVVSYVYKHYQNIHMGGLRVGTETNRERKKTGYPQR